MEEQVAEVLGRTDGNLVEIGDLEVEGMLVVKSLVQTVTAWGQEFPRKNLNCAIQDYSLKVTQNV